MTLRAMVSRPASDRDDRGFTTASFVLALGIAMVVLVALVNFVAYQYGRSAVRSAIDQAARAGSRASAGAGSCEARANETLDVVLGGPMGDDIAITCTDDGQLVEATATGTFHGWIEVVPDWSWSITATATKEQTP